MLNEKQRCLAKVAQVPIAPVYVLDGGDISSVVRMDEWVLKTSMKASAKDQYTLEAEGLSKLRVAGCLTPDIQYAGAEGLVLRYYPPTKPSTQHTQDFAERLARLHTECHASAANQSHGYLGNLRLESFDPNLPWRDIFLDHRLEPFYRRACGIDPQLRTLEFERLRRLDFPEEGRCLVHGDLWQGNLLSTSGGIFLIDPSVWLGERGMDLAMLSLFGRPSPQFWQTYTSLAPIPSRVKRFLPLYQLYYAFAHVVLFGASYSALCQSLWRKFWSQER